MFLTILDSLIEDLKTILEAFPEIIQEYDWILALIVVAIAVGYVSAKLIIAYLQSVPESAIEKVREIAELSNDEIEKLKQKNERVVVTRLVESAKETIYIWDHRSKFDERKVEMAKQAFSYLPQRYEDIKEGRVFSEYKES